MFWVVEHVPPHPDITSLTAGDNYGPTALSVEVGEGGGEMEILDSVLQQFFSVALVGFLNLYKLCFLYMIREEDCMIYNHFSLCLFLL